MRVFGPQGQETRAKKLTTEQIIRKLREGEVMAVQGKGIAEACQALEISAQTYHRWKKCHGQLDTQVDQLRGPPPARRAAPECCSPVRNRLNGHLGAMRVTLAIVPRERFSFARASLENILANTRHPFRLVYVDGGSPREVRDYLLGASREHGFELIRRDYILTPNEARNLALRQVETEFVVFVDNDVTVEPGWLEQLVSCADETGAWLVGPLYMIGPPGTDVIHMAGGDMAIEEDAGVRVFREKHRFGNEPFARHREKIRRARVDFVEFHAMLARRDVFDRIGQLDEQLMNHNEHIDLCLLVDRAGGEIFLEPNSRVTYSPSPARGPGDRAFHLLRWSPQWSNRSLDRFAKKWQLERHTPSFRGKWRWAQRHRKSIYRWFGALDPILSPAVTWRESRKRERHLADQ